MLSGAVIVMLTVSEEVSVPSSAVSVKMTSVSESTGGAVNVVEAEVALASVISKIEGL